MKHRYIVISEPYIGEAITKGRTNYDQPQYNRSIRYAIDNSKVLIEGLFNDDDMAWFESVAICIGDVTEAYQYIADHRTEWETDQIIF